MLVDKLQKRHPARCLFFVGLLFCSTLAVAESSASRLPESRTCLADLAAEPVTVVRITDGDTVVLDDARRVRLIGLNTLELNASSEQDKQMARRARQALGEFLEGQAVMLIAGRDPHDRHGRSLAHVRLSNGGDAAQFLVSQGLGLPVAVGNNTRCAYVLQRLGQAARKAGRGLWASPGDWYLDQPRRIGLRRGFHVSKGRVERISGRGSRTSLELDNGLRVTLGRYWPRNGKQARAELLALVGEEVEVRGWLSNTNGKPRLILYHPANLELASH
ncbi:MAG: hypothetical protein HKN42_00770 [Granulosicoccus sp.]|nr:hypothetical protein [Granulosicoccus sp.]